MVLTPKAGIFCLQCQKSLWLLCHTLIKTLGLMSIWYQSDVKVLTNTFIWSIWGSRAIRGCLPVYCKFYVDKFFFGWIQLAIEITFWNTKFYILFHMPLKLFRRFILELTALVQLMAWCQTGHKPIPDPMLTMFWNSIWLMSWLFGYHFRQSRMLFIKQHNNSLWYQAISFRSVVMIE